MKLRFFGVSCALALCTLMAKAQNSGGLYLNPIVTRASNSVADSGPFAFLGQNKTSGIFGGVDLGGYVDFFQAGPLKGGLDFREEIEHANGASLDSFLLGLRLVHTSPTSKWRPYLQPAFGEGRTKPELSDVHKTKFGYAISAGADYPLGRRVDFRAIEIGYGSVTTVSSSQFNSSPSVPAAKLINFSTGFVFRIP